MIDALRSLLFLGFLVTNTFSDTLVAQQPTALATVPLRSDGLLVSIAGKIHDRTINLDLDSGGLWYTIIDTAVVKELRLPANGTGRVGGTGKGTVPFVRLAPLSIAFGSTVYRPPAPISLDYTQIGRPTHQDGLLGFDFFWNFVIAVNYDHRTVTLYDPRSYVYTGAGAKIPLIIRSPRAFVRVRLAVPGVPVKERTLRLDSGSEDAVDDDIFLRSTAPKKLVRSGRGLGTEFQAYSGAISALTLGPYTLRDLPAVSGGVPLVGSAVLHKFNVIYDFRHAAMYLEPR